MKTSQRIVRRLPRQMTWDEWVVSKNGVPIRESLKSTFFAALAEIFGRDTASDMTEPDEHGVYCHLGTFGRAHMREHGFTISPVITTIKPKGMRKNKP